MSPLLTGVLCLAPAAAVAASVEAAETPRGKTVRIGAAQPRARIIDPGLEPSAALARVEQSLGELETLVAKAGAAGCDALALPEDTLGLGRWEAGNMGREKELLPAAVGRMLERLGRAAAVHHLYLVCSNDTAGTDGAIRNTSFLLGRDGKEIGRYHKVNMPIGELYKKRGDVFPVFNTPDLGSVGMLICYDMVFPEAARCLALGGADIIFNPTLGGAAVGDEELNRAAFRTRAVENFIYVVVAARGGGSMIISPQGKVLAEGKGADEIVTADVDPFGGREGGDAFNYQRDMRARLFRERSASAFRILSDPNPPALKRVPAAISIPEAVRVAARTYKEGDARFEHAEALLRQGELDEAVAAFKMLRADFPQTWVDRLSQERLQRIAGMRRERQKGEH